MNNITANEMRFVLMLLKSPEEDVNSRNISKIIGISHMGSFKISKKLEKEGIIVSKQIGRGRYFKINFAKSYTKRFIRFLLNREGEQAHPYIKRWINELKKINGAKIIILFGSIITKYNEARDVDVLLITENKNFNLLKKEVELINSINIKKIHPIYQNKGDLIRNISKKDKIILNAIKGIIVKGEEDFINIMKK